MLETNNLEKKIKDRIKNVLPDTDLNKIKFCIGTDSSLEGEYIYAQNGKYHYVFTEKGKIRVQKELDTEDDVLWIVLESVLFDLAMDYAMKNRIPGKDFRRPLFAKEIELYEKFGKEFERKKRREIDNVLKDNPFCDK